MFTMQTTARTELNVRLREMRFSTDLAAVMAIERRVFECPWTLAEFDRADDRRIVAVTGGEVVGYMVLENHAGYTELANLAVNPDFRRRGVGRRLLGLLRNQAIVWATVRETNLDAQLFFRAAGFKARNVLRDHYADISESGYRFCYRQPILNLGRIQS